MLPETVMNYLNEAAAQTRARVPDEHTSLFASGLLDSFSLVEFVTLIERECGITVPDSQLRPENFDTLARIDAFIERARLN